MSVATLTGALVVGSPATAAPTPAPSPTATSTPAPRPINLALAVDLLPGTVLTLPAKDGLRDRATLRVLSGRSGLVDVDAIRGTKTVRLASRVALRSTKQGWVRTVAVRADRLKAGSWRIHVRRSAMHGVWAWSASPLRVGTGSPVHVGVRPAARTLYPYKDGVLDSALLTVTAKDETGALVPVTGTLRVDSGKKHVTRKLTRTGTSTLPVTTLPLGAATATATVTGPSGTKAVRRTALTLAPTGVGTARVVRSADTVQPVIDGFLDSVVLTTTGAASAGSTAKVSGTLAVTKGRTVAATFPVPDGAPHAFLWDGRLAGKVVPGVYTVTLTLKGPQGLPTTRTKTVLVSSQHLPYRVQDLFAVSAGNQQGLAVHDGTFYVGYDNGDGTSRIDLYSSSGAVLGSWPLSIGHAAELSYSTTTNLLYAANGGPTSATTVWSIDPATGTIRDTFDLSALGPNGMVAVDDVDQQLLVFTGTAATGYTVSRVGMQLGSSTDTTTGVVTSSPVVLGSTAVAITGTPQGIELVGTQLWIYTSLKKVNHIAKYELSTTSPATGSGSSSDLMYAGEGEGLAYQAVVDPQSTGTGLPGWMYVGAHSTNRIGLLLAVADE
jgi:hypothetical protein